LGESVTLRAPEILADHHQIADFDCGVPALDEWLKRRALANQTSGASRTYVACDDSAVGGYYALASGAVTTSAAPGRFRRNMPDPIPVVILARLAVGLEYHGKGLGRALFRDAAKRVLHASDVHAISEEAKAFYLALGLTPSPLEPLTLMVSLTDLRAAL
jgi:GNAT superfamily N-acetyltransferase